jgi:hypothetical protein
MLQAALRIQDNPYLSYQAEITGTSAHTSLLVA